MTQTERIINCEVIKTTAQRLRRAHRIMDDAIRGEAYNVVAMYAMDINGYMNMLESDARRLMYREEYILNGIIDS